MKNKYNEMTDLELNGILLDYFKEYFSFRNQLKIGKLSDTSKIKKMKKNIAIIKTELNKRKYSKDIINN